MDLNQAALYLEIFGIILATLFGAVLLAPEVSGRLASKLADHLSVWGTELNKAVSAKLPKYFGQRLTARLLKSYLILANRSIVLCYCSHRGAIKTYPNPFLDCSCHTRCCASMEVGQLASGKFATTPPGEDIIKPNQEG